ncbi:hypothetical protein [Leptotrichia buccalis]|uniref:Uncharacterized protein n=1 Tax=Leptotrichia buccalis (strain ATCC 14201 / DSM 1135 / JCM 12969 / NCTC 10249 / C-1013-b) TaxID=523794 RepID=C7NCI2_LEPBD|nr:hypothetical protein [Leptotrichia buccalis]ACV39828.1 hypothetical protein Lebu_1966 [Leptotrichia buccalis C-1013-b]
MNFRNIMKKMILILGVIGISTTSFSAFRKNNKIVYVKKEPSRKVKKKAKKNRQIVYIKREPSHKVKKYSKRNNKIVYVKREPSRRHRKH